MDDQEIESRRHISAGSLWGRAKESAPAWLVAVVRNSRKVRFRAERRLRKFPGFHAMWIMFQRLRFKLIPPRTLNQKIRYRMAYDRRDILKITTDKIGVRAYIEKKVGIEHLTILYGFYDDSDDIVFENLPRNYVMKATHASGATLLVDERAPSGSSLPTWDEVAPYPFLARIHPDSVPTAQIRKLADTWLQSPYGRTGNRPQWAYQGLTPRIMFEELLDDGRGNVPPDYKILCFNGEPSLIQVIAEREHESQRAFYTATWQRVLDKHTVASPPIEQPNCLKDMLLLARELAEELDFVRVDLYAINDRLLVGELTHYPAGSKVIGGGRGPLTSAASHWSPSSVA